MVRSLTRLGCVFYEFRIKLNFLSVIIVFTRPFEYRLSCIPRKAIVTPRVYYLDVKMLARGSFYFISILFLYHNILFYITYFGVSKLPSYFQQSFEALSKNKLTLWASNRPSLEPALKWLSMTLLLLALVIFRSSLAFQVPLSAPFCLYKIMLLVFYTVTIFSRLQTVFKLQWTIVFWDY